MDELERAEQVYHCRYVDKLIVRSPWVMTQEYLDEHEIDFVIHGDDNSFDENGKDAYAFIKSIGKYKELQRTDGISTTDLITRILKDYHGYITRCMRRGFTHTDLNIPDNVWVRTFSGLDPAASPLPFAGPFSNHRFLVFLSPTHRPNYNNTLKLKRSTEPELVTLTRPETAHVKMKPPSLYPTPHTRKPISASH